MKTYRVTLRHYADAEAVQFQTYQTENIFDAADRARAEFKETPFRVAVVESVGGPGKETLTLRKYPK